MGVYDDEQLLVFGRLPGAIVTTSGIARDQA